MVFIPQDARWQTPGGGDTAEPKRTKKAGDEMHIIPGFICPAL
jgi:hypothetical protein